MQDRDEQVEGRGEGEEFGRICVFLDLIICGGLVLYRYCCFLSYFIGKVRIGLTQVQKK